MVSMLWGCLRDRRYRSPPWTNGRAKPLHQKKKEKLNRLTVDDDIR